MQEKTDNISKLPLLERLDDFDQRLLSIEDKEQPKMDAYTKTETNLKLAVQEERTRRMFESVKAEFTSLRSEMSAFKAVVVAKLESSKTELIKWYIGTGIAIVGILIAFIALTK